MTSLTLALAILDLALALAVSAIAILGSRRALPDDTDPLLVRQALHRARLHFSILALGWT